MNNILILVFVIISIIVFSMVLKKKSEERTKNTTAIFETNKTKYFASLDKDINFRKRDEIFPIKTRYAFVCGNPQIAFFVFLNVVDGIVRKSVYGGENLGNSAVVSTRRWCS